MPKSARSTTEFVYCTLRDDLALCLIKPGERLLTERLRARFGVSFTVIREALTRLAVEGFCVADPQRGFTAAEISAEDILMLTEARIGVENLCLRESILLEHFHIERKRSRFLDAAFSEPSTANGQLENALGDAAWQEDIARRRDEVLALPVATESQPDRISREARLQTRGRRRSAQTGGHHACHAEIR